MNVKKSNLDFDNLNILDTLDLYYEPMNIASGDKARRKELAGYITDAFLFFFAMFDLNRQFGELADKVTYERLLADRVSDAVSKVTGIDGYMSNHISQMSKEVVNTTFKNEVKPSLSNPYGIPDNNHSQSIEKSSFVHPHNLNEYNPLSNSALTEDKLHYFSGSLVPPYANGPTSKNEPIPTDSTGTDSGGYWLSYNRAEDIAKNEANTFLNYTDYVDAKERGATKKRWLTMLDNKVRPSHFMVEGETIGID